MVFVLELGQELVAPPHYLKDFLAVAHVSMDNRPDYLLTAIILTARKLSLKFPKFLWIFSGRKISEQKYSGRDFKQWVSSLMSASLKNLKTKKIGL